jgi:hypothetical protein
MITQAQIGEQINLLLDDTISLDDFEDWLALESWNMHANSSEEAQRLAWAIELNLSEHSSGHLSDDELKSELASLIPKNPGVELRRTIEIQPNVFVETGTGMFIESFQTQLMDYVDTQLVGASE